MLVNCQNCGTPFDVEKRGSICPKCNTDINKIKKKKTREEKTTGKGQLKPCLVIIILIIIVAAYTIYIKVSTETSAKRQRQVGVLEPQIVQMNEKIYIDVTGSNALVFAIITCTASSSIPCPSGFSRYRSLSYLNPEK